MSHNRKHINRHWCSLFEWLLLKRPVFRKWLFVNFNHKFLFVGWCNWRRNHLDRPPDWRVPEASWALHWRGAPPQGCYRRLWSCQEQGPWGPGLDEGDLHWGGEEKHPDPSGQDLPQHQSPPQGLFIWFNSFLQLLKLLKFKVRFSFFCKRVFTLQKQAS